MTSQETIAAIAAALQSPASIEAGMINEGSLQIKGTEITFDFPAPVLSGACVGKIWITHAGLIHDDTSDEDFETFEEWKAAFEECIALGMED